MTPSQRCLVVLAHVLLACALLGTTGPVPPLLSVGCALASLLGLTRALGAPRSLASLATPNTRQPKGRQP
jgi:hypothetical protein